MKQAIIAICDKEEKYALQMQDFFLEKKAPYRIHTFSRQKDFLEFYDQNQITILLMAQSFYQQGLPLCKTDHFYVLQELQSCCIEGAICISKYQSAELIYKQIMMNSYQSEKGNSLEKGTSSEIIGIYTPVKRCLQTSFSLVLGQLLAKKKKVLYLNFEAYSGFSVILRKKCNHDLSDLLYTLRNAEDKLMQRLSTMVESVNNLDFIPPSSSVMDLETTNGEEVEKLIKAIAGNSFYDYIILDLSDSIQGLFTVLTMCQTIYTITKNDGIAMAKIEQYEKTITQAQQETILEKTKKCNIPQFSKLPEHMEELPYCELAHYVEKIVKEDFYGSV